MSGADASSAAAAAGPFVLNLCSSSTPMALAQTELPELKRFNFFVSRRFEEGRERFRLHMGYFATLAEAEEWLNVVREIYPGAWAGEAPGRKLRERAAAAAADQARHAAGPQPRVAPAAPRPVMRAAAVPAAPAAAPRPQAAPPPAMRVPVVHAAPQQPVRAAPRPAAAVAPRQAAPLAVPARVAAAPAPRVRPAAPVASPAARSIPVARAIPAAAPRPNVVSRPAAAGRPAVAAAPRAAAPRPGAGRVPAKPVFEDSNVRDVLAALGETSTTGETRLMHAPLAPRAAPAAADSALSDTQVLRVLEDRRPADGARQADGQARNIPLLKPDDTGTRKALKDAVAANAPVWFAVQLQWSVQPVELDKVPPLAIFTAYTLYTVEGSRDGRHWYGLRLGFFSDAISAKQVAYYVRSEFGSVAVVPVSPEERTRATEADQKAAKLATPEPPRRAEAEEFKLIDMKDEPLPPSAARLAAGKPAARSPARPAPAAGARARGRVGARERRGGPSLEETLEILGATELTIEDDRGETLNDTGVRHLQVEVQKNSPFVRLLDRLSERMKKS